MIANDEKPRTQVNKVTIFYLPIFGELKNHYKLGICFQENVLNIINFLLIFLGVSYKRNLFKRIYLIQYPLF
jgi:hypothetical protein